MRMISSARVLALALLLFLFVGGGTALASYVVSSNSQIGPGTVAGHHPPLGKHANLISGSVNAKDLAPSSVTANQLAAKAVTGAKVKDGSLSAFDLAAPVRLPQGCSASKIAKWTGSIWACATDQNSGGTVTSVGSGTGLAGGPITGSGSLSITTPYQLPQGCSSGQVAKSDGASSWSCANDQSSGGTITEVTTSDGLTGGGSSGSVNVGVDSGQIQSRVTGSCSGAQAVQSIAQGGGVGCGSFWSLTGNSGTDPSTDFLGTTDNQPLNLKVNGARALRLEPTASDPNLIGGFSGNTVTSGAASAAIAGGGSSGNENKVTDSFGAVGGGQANRAGDNSGTAVDRPAATVAGGENNIASGTDSGIGGGNSNTASNTYSAVGGGFGNTASSPAATVAGGDGNTASANFATVGGGLANTASGTDAVVAGGRSSTASGDNSLAAGRRAKATNQGAFVWGDSTDADVSSTAADQFTARASGGVRLFSSSDTTGASAPGVELFPGTSALGTLGTGNPFDLRVNTGVAADRGLRIAPASDGTNQSPNVIGGIADNTVTSGAFAATIAGGGRSTPANAATANRVTDNYGTVGGGANNQAGDAAGFVNDRQYATVAGGSSNSASGLDSAVGGGRANTASGIGAAVGGGFGNTVDGSDATAAGGDQNTASATKSAVGGGDSNTASGSDAVVAGGVSNTASGPFGSDVAGGNTNTAGGSSAVVAGGFSNQAYGDNSFIGGGSNNDAPGQGATVSGGGAVNGNSVGNTASGDGSTVAGGDGNTASGGNATVGGGVDNYAPGDTATIPGGSGNEADGAESLAAGHNALAVDHGAFVWGDDSTNTSTVDTGANSFVARASGGVTFYTAAGSSTTTGATLAGGSGSWSSLSDRHAKTAIRPVSGRSVLSKLRTLPINTWRYKAEKGGVRHLGPMAQAFYRRFGLGESNRYISDVDAQGVALAGIKGLAARFRNEHQRLRAERRRNRSQGRRIRSQGEEIATLQRTVGRLSRRR